MNKGNFFATLKLYLVSRCLAEHSGNRYPPLRIFDSTMDGTSFIEIFVIPMLHELLGKLLVLYKVVKVFATNLTSKSGSKTILYNVDIGWLGIEVS